MDVAWQRYVDLIADFTEVTQKRAEHVVRALVRRGEAEASKGERAFEGLIDRAGQNCRAISSMMRSELERGASRLGLARQSDVDRLQTSISRLEVAIRNLGGVVSVNSATGQSPPQSSAAEARASAEADPVEGEPL